MNKTDRDFNDEWYEDWYFDFDDYTELDFIQDLERIFKYFREIINQAYEKIINKEVYENKASS